VTGAGRFGFDGMVGPAVRERMRRRDRSRERVG